MGVRVVAAVNRLHGAVPQNKLTDQVGITALTTNPAVASRLDAAAEMVALIAHQVVASLEVSEIVFTNFGAQVGIVDGANVGLAASALSSPPDPPTCSTIIIPRTRVATRALCECG